MPAVTNAFTSYAAQANREDLSDVIYNIDPFDTPLMTAAGRRNVSNVLFEWQTEALPAQDLTTRDEGFEIARQAGTATKRVHAVCEIKERNATVSGTQNAADAAGKRSEMAHQMALTSKALKRDCEIGLFGSTQVESQTDPRTTRALRNWLATNFVAADTGTPSTAPDPDTNTAVGAPGTPGALDEDTFNDLIQGCYENGAEPSLVVVGPYNKRVFSTFTGRTNSRHQIQANKVVNTVSLYASDFGDLKVIPSRWIDPGDLFAIDPRYVRIGFYRNFQSVDIAKIGDADTKMLVVELGLQVDNEAAHGQIVGLTTSA